MPVYSSGYSGPHEIIYLFVDGGSLRGKLENVSRDFFQGKTFDLDFAKLVSDFTKVFYYDAVPIRTDGEDEATYNARIRPQRELLVSAAGLDRIHVYEGDARKRRKVGLEQKKVDVMIAVDMLTHTFRHNMHKATLLTGDNDFKPLIDALVQEGMFVTLWYPCGETSKELMNAADTRKRLGLVQLRELLTSDSARDFSIPVAINMNPSVEPGTRITEWVTGGVRYTLNMDQDEYIVLRDGDKLNRLHLRHGDVELLRLYCKEEFDTEVPQITSGAVK
jgi:uncharacterized LabA/DUF88 family protein